MLVSSHSHTVKQERFIIKSGLNQSINNAICLLYKLLTANQLRQYLYLVKPLASILHKYGSHNAESRFFRF